MIHLLKFILYIIPSILIGIAGGIEAAWEASKNAWS